MSRACGELIHQPGVDGAEGELAGLGAAPGAVDVVEKPSDFAGGEIRIEYQACLLSYQGLVPGGSQSLDRTRCAAVLPDDGVVDRLPAGSFPDNRGLALVGDADRRNLRSACAGVPQGLLGDADLGALLQDEAPLESSP